MNADNDKELMTVIDDDTSAEDAEFARTLRQAAGLMPKREESPPPPPPTPEE